MKKLLLSFLILFCLQLAPANAQWVTIPDANFVTWLQTNYPTCMYGNQMDTTCYQIVNASAVDFSYNNISDLTGIEYFDNLITLDCHGNSLTTLPLPHYTGSLVNLLCSQNQLTSLPAIPNSIGHLDCSENQLTSIPTLPASLHWLECRSNQLTILPALPDSLYYLECNGNQLTSLPSLPNLLIELKVGNNQLNNLQALPNTLQALYCNSNLLSSIPPLPNTITTFYYGDNPISAHPILPNTLKYFGCNDLNLTSLPQLPDSLRSLFCENNSLTSLPTLPAFLQFLYCEHNQLSSLPALPNYLYWIQCGNNQLTSLPNLPSSLNYLYCDSNQLTSIPAIPNSLLTLICFNNQISSLPLLPNSMYEFKAYNNNISCLTNLPQVNILNNGNIQNNPITCVPNQTNYTFGLPLCMDNDPVNNPFNCQSVVNITGYVFKDLNSNCNYNNSDLRSENVAVKLFDNQNNFLAYSNTVNGVYGFTTLQPDTYKVKINDSTQLVSMACGQANNQIVVLDSVNQTISNVNFPVICDSNYDIKVQSLNTNGFVFPGQTHTISVNIANNLVWYNLNCVFQNYSGTVTVQVNGPLSFVSSVSGALTPFVNGNTFTYTITDFNSLTPNSFGLRFLSDTTAQAGDQICVHVEINPTPLDGDTTNNVYDFCYNVVNSYDPNMKEVYPVNVLPGYDDWFTYTIHFQNTGNAPAFNIRLRDTLDANLDINSFEVRGYSHPAQITINGNILTVRFNNIMLADSTTDYEGSMGYFQYRLKPLPNLPNGTQIENTAYIYFDYNAPIITNTTQNNFDIAVKTNNALPQVARLWLYPNPSTGIFTFNESQNIKTVEVFNILGELVLRQGNAKIINLQAFPKGIYVVRINGSQVCRLVKE